MKLNGAGAACEVQGDFQISAGGRVVYRARQDDPTKNELYSVPLTGGAVVKLNDPLGSGVDVQGFLVSDDRVVFDIGSSLYSVPIDGSSSPVPLGSSVDHYKDSPDAARIVYVGSGLPYGIFSVPVDGGPTSALNGPGGVVQWYFALSSTRVAYSQVTSSLPPFTIELFSAPIDGSSAAIQLGRAAGARVIATAGGADKVAILERLGIQASVN